MKIKNTEDISKVSVDELISWIVSNFQNETEIHFVAKPPIASKILSVFEKNTSVSKSIVHMESFECRHLIPAKNTQVLIERPNKNDLNELSQFCRNFEKECFGRELSEEDGMNDAAKLLDNQKAYIVQVDGKAVAMAKSARETTTHISVNGVYTFSEYRKRGYAAAVVAHICILIFNLESEWN